MSIHYAWPQYREPWALSVELSCGDLDCDGAVDDSRRTIRLDEVDGWATATLTFALSTTEKQPVAVGELSAYVMLSAPRANTRLPVQLTPSQSGFEGSVTVARQFLAGSVEVTGHVAGTDATVRLVGETEPWTLIVDPGDAPPQPGAPPFQTIPISFSSDDAPSQIQLASDSFAVMDTTGPKPILYINKDVTGLEAILYSERPRLEKRRLRDVLSAQLAYYAAGVLFREAVAQTEFDEDQVMLPTDPLLAQICEVVATQVESVEGAEEMMRRLFASPAERGDLYIQIDNALTRLTNLGEHVSRATEEVHYA